MAANSEKSIEGRSKKWEEYQVPLEFLLRSVKSEAEIPSFLYPRAHPSVTRVHYGATS